MIEELPASAEHAIVMKSTVPVGTGANVRRRLGELGKGGLGYASNPEFLKEGSAVADFMNPDRVVVGLGRAHRPGPRTRSRGCTSRSTARSCAPTSPRPR